MNAAFKTLEFDRILEQLSQYANGENAKEKCKSLSPILSESLCQRALLETNGARKLIETCGTPPVSVMNELEECLTHAQAGGMLLPEQLEQIARFIIACQRMAAYLKRGEGYENMVSLYGRAILPLDEIRQEIETCVEGERVMDSASTKLRQIRRSLEGVEGRIRERLNHLLQSKKRFLADSYVSQRNGRYVLPVLKQHQQQIVGTVIDSSRSGGTVFIEPASVSSLQQERDEWLLEEDQEIRRILYELSDLVAQHAHSLHANAQCMHDLDFLFAKGMYSLALNGREAKVGCERKLVLNNARHPLLNAENCVPLNLDLDPGIHGMVITGPNTGGKTVALKTVGLLTMMAQSGLHIPCEEGTSIPMRDAICCDIGDSQSISQNLSTFSGHMTNVIGILSSLSKDSLILLDELGSGTDPAEGMGIAIAVLEALRQTGCTFLATTHYEQVKTYVEHADHVISARMAFDSETLRPLYRLEMGKSGKSCALDIVKRLGMPQNILDCASLIVRHGGCIPVMPKLKLAAAHSTLVKPAEKPVIHTPRWTIGDSVQILPEKENGIVYQPEDEFGNVIVHIKGEKRTIRHNRLKLLVPASELYPEDYDFSIVFDTVENRKARHILSKRYDEEATVVIRKGNNN